MKSLAQYTPVDQTFDFEARSSNFHLENLETRRAAIPSIISPFQAPPKARVILEEPAPWQANDHPWRRGITASVFWIGEKASERNPVANDRSAWDPNWQINYGGEDHPANRRGYLPATFSPRLNPFYAALPYNDIAPDGTHYHDASEQVPWFWQKFRSANVSVCKGQWLAIHYRGKVAYAQWEDAGPHHSNDWQYVFQGKAPKPSQYGNVGIEISPALRDYLGIRSGFRVAWKFVDRQTVPPGPWLKIP